MLQDRASIVPGRSFRRKSMAKEMSRKDHLGELVKNRRASVDYMQTVVTGVSNYSTIVLSDEQKASIIEQSKFIKEALEHAKTLNQSLEDNTPLNVEVKMNNFSYKLKVDEESHSIRTVYNQSFIYNAGQSMKRIYRGEKKPEPKEKVLLDRINLVFKPGRMYLVLGEAGTGGKELLLKAVAGRLHSSSEAITEGTILYNGLSIKVRSSERVFCHSSESDDYSPTPRSLGEGRRFHRELYQFHRQD
jgi:ABC-type multidrug transport system fused ATPase/permease subunit